MAEYGTKEYYLEQLKERIIDKEIYKNALEKAVEKDDGFLIEKISERIYQANLNIKFYGKKFIDFLKDSLKEKNKNKEEK